MQAIEAIGHWRIVPFTGYLEAAFTTGKLPKLNPHKIIFSIQLVYVKWASTIYRSLHIISYPTSLALD